MKTIGHTNEGQVLVQLTEAEFKTLGKLKEALEGQWSLSPFLRADRVSRCMDHDFEKVFEAIHAWALVRCKINDFRGLLDEIQEHLTEPESTE